jgi:hypothetical protein
MYESIVGEFFSATGALNKSMMPSLEFFAVFLSNWLIFLDSFTFSQPYLPHSFTKCEQYSNNKICEISLM